jgi:hypothetical protein
MVLPPYHNAGLKKVFQRCAEGTVLQCSGRLQTLYSIFKVLKAMKLHTEREKKKKKKKKIIPRHLSGDFDGVHFLRRLSIAKQFVKRIEVGKTTFIDHLEECIAGRAFKQQQHLSNHQQ